MCFKRCKLITRLEKQVAELPVLLVLSILEYTLLLLRELPL